MDEKFENVDAFRSWFGAEFANGAFYLDKIDKAGIALVLKDAPEDEPHPEIDRLPTLTTTQPQEDDEPL